MQATSFKTSLKATHDSHLRLRPSRDFRERLADDARRLPLHQLQTPNWQRVWCLGLFRQDGSETAVTQRIGETKVYAFHYAAQKLDQARHFCPHCGTTLFWFVSTLPEKIGIAGGCFAADVLPDPTYSVNDNKREAWVKLPANWATYPG